MTWFSSKYRRVYKNNSFNVHLIVKNCLQLLTKYCLYLVFFMTEAYCVKCRKKQEIMDPEETKLKNGRPAVKGKCPVCNTNVFRIGKP